MLAAFLTIKRELYEEEKKDTQLPDYSFASAPDRNKIQIDSDSEFAEAIKGMNVEEFLPVMDELMSTLQVIQPRLYSAVMMKLS